jgi:hypothetical protein
MASFVKIGRDIIVGKGLSAKHWGGPVVFGRDAIYACPDITKWLLLQGHDSAASVAGAAFGLVGALVAGAAQRSTRSEDGWKSWVVDSMDLPTEVTGSSDWPLKKMDRPVIVLKREHVTKIERKGGKFLVESCGGTFRFALKFFGRSDAVAQVQQLGWQI